MTPAVEQHLADFIGRPCWYVSCGGASWAAIDLILGDRVPRAEPLRNPTASPAFRDHSGSHELLVWCSWRLDDAAGAIVSSADEASASDRLDVLVGDTVLSFDCTPPMWDAVVRFASGRTLHIFADFLAPTWTLPNWETTTPTGSLTAGPGTPLVLEPCSVP